LACIIVLASCKKTQPTAVVNEVTFDTIQISDIYHLEGDSTKPSCSLKLNYIAPVKYADQDILDKMQKELNVLVFEDELLGSMSPQDAAKRFAKNYIENYKEEAQTRFPNWAESHETEDYFSFYKTIETVVLYNNSSLLSYQVSAMDYKGGANSYTAYKNAVIDLKTGKLLSEEDIFKSGYEKALNQILIDKIVSQNKAKKAEDLLELGFWGIEDLTSNGNFLIDSTKLTYIFSQGEYSAPSLGEIRVTIPYKEIYPILKEQSPISLFFE
jgi:hypothetical protein